MTEKIALRVQHKRMTKEDWLKSDAILLEGEIGVESDTGYIKSGNGTDYFPDLPYLSGPPGIIVKGQFDYLEDLKNTYPTGNFGEGYQIKNEDKTVYAWGERHATKSASGSAITLEDSATANLRGLRLYGRSWQDGEPSIEEPKEIHSVENAGMKIRTENLLVEKEIVVNSGKREFVQVADLAPIFDAFPNRKFTVSFDLRTKKVYNGGYMRVYMQNSEGSRYYFVLKDLHGVTTEFKRYSFTGTPRLINPSEKYALLALYGVYNTGNIPEFKNVKLEFGENETDWNGYSSPNDITVPHKLNAVSVSSGGNYTDETGQQWIADYVDFDRGVLVKRCEKHSLSGVRSINLNSDNFISAFFTLGTDILISNVSKVLAWEKLDKTHESTWYHSKSSCGILLNKNRLSTPDLKGVKKWCSDNNAYFLSANDDSIEIPLSDSELQAYAKLHTLYPYTTILNDQGAHMEVDYQSMEIEGEWLDVGKFHTDTNDVTQLQADMVLKANKRDLVDDVPRINELEGKIKELSSKIDRIVANGT